MPCKTPTSPEQTWYCGRHWLCTSLSVTPKPCVVLILENYSAPCLFIWTVFNNNLHFEHILPTSEKSEVHNSSIWEGDFVRIPIKLIVPYTQTTWHNEEVNRLILLFKLNPRYSSTEDKPSPPTGGQGTEVLDKNPSQIFWDSKNSLLKGLLKCLPRSGIWSYPDTWAPLFSSSIIHTG